MNITIILEWVKINKARLIAYIIFAVITFGLYLFRYQPVLLHDDWWYVRVGEMGGFPWFSLSGAHDGRRPLMFFPFALVASIFGTGIDTIYIVGLFLLFFSAVIMYELLSIFVNKNNKFNYSLLIVCVFLAYPVLSRQWFTLMGGKGIFILLLNCLLIYMYFIKRKYYLLVLALLFLIATLLAGEGGFGLVLGWSALLFIADKYRDKKLLFPYLILAFYVAWSLTRSSDVYMTRVMNSSIINILFSTVKNTVISIYSSFYYWGYGLPLPQRPIIGGLPLYVSNGILLGMVMFFILVFGYGISHFVQSKIDADDGDYLRLAKKLMFSGGILYLFAFFPTNLAFGAGFTDTLGTRHFSFPSIGASVLIVGFVLLINTLLTRNQTKAKVATITSVLLICVLGVAAHGQFRNNLNNTWERQKDLWAQLFEEVPNLHDDTFVLFLVTRSDDVNSLPAIRRGEANDGLKLLYNNPSLAGSAIDVNSLDRLTTRGFEVSENNIVPWERLMLIKVDESTGSLALISIADDFQIEVPENYDPQSLIIDHRDPTQFRYLVER